MSSLPLSPLPPKGDSQRPLDPHTAEAVMKERAVPPVGTKAKDEIAPARGSHGKGRMGARDDSVLDPLDHVKPSQPFTGFAADQKPQQYNILNAIAVMEKLFSTQGEQADVLLEKINAMTTQLNTVLGQLVDATTEQGILQADIDAKAEPAWETWLNRGLQTLGAAAVGFLLGGPVGAVAAVVTTFAMMLLADPKSFGIQGMAPSFGPDGWFTKMSDGVADFFTTLFDDPKRAFTGPLDHNAAVDQWVEFAFQIAFAISIGLVTGAGLANLSDSVSALLPVAAEEAPVAAASAAEDAADAAEDVPDEGSGDGSGEGEAPVSGMPSVAQAAKEASELEGEIVEDEEALAALKSPKAPQAVKASEDFEDAALSKGKPVEAGKAGGPKSWDGLRSKGWMFQQFVGTSQNMGTWNTFALDCVKAAHPDWPASQQKEWANYIAMGISLTLMIGSGVGSYLAAKSLKIVSEASTLLFMQSLQGVQMVGTAVTSAYDAYRFGETVPLLHDLGDVQEQMGSLAKQSFQAQFYVQQLQQTFQGTMDINALTGDTVETILQAWEQPIQVLSQQRM